jgi:hypothetical protein
MEILAQPLCETVSTPTTFRHTKRLPIRISKPSHKKFHFKKKDFFGFNFQVSCQHAPINLRFKKAQQLTVSNAFPAQEISYLFWQQKIHGNIVQCSAHITL